MNPLLNKLQNLDAKIAHCERELDRLDDGSAARETFENARQTLETQNAQLKEITTRRKELEDESANVESKIALQQKRLMNAKNAHEVTSLQRDIEALTHRRGELDEAVLLAMDEGEAQESTLAQTRNQVEAAQTTARQIEGRFKIETERLENESEAAQSERDEVWAQLDEISQKKYAQYAERFHGLGVAHMEDGNCSACGTALTPYNLRAAKSEEWPTCENCNRLLFVS